VQSLLPQAEAKHITLSFEDSAGATDAVADRRALGQILINLVNNAIKFTNTGAVRVELFAVDVDGRVRISVTDTGPGIPEADLVRIFHAFERSVTSAKATDEATGLGLHISQKLAELLRASITVDSVVGEGSTFTVSLTESGFFLFAASSASTTRCFPLFASAAPSSGNRQSPPKTHRDRLPPVSSERASKGDFPTRHAYSVHPKDQMSTLVSITVPVLTSNSSGARYGIVLCSAA